ncbi:SPOR domain-containing protein [Caldanaerobacter sp.]|uniref:SPOR domain-containing protein n=1 Tax=Caldanaerobacter sp. TaxID=2930036 RepID=UPI003C78E339
MKNETMLEVLLVIIIIPLVSLLAGYFITQNAVDRSLANEESSFKYLTIKGVDGFEVIESIQRGDEEAKHRQNMLALKQVFSLIEKEEDKYRVVLGIFLTKEEAMEYAGLMSSKGISTEIYAKKAPYLKVRYDKNLTSEIEYFTNKLGKFQQILQKVSLLSLKSVEGGINFNDIQELDKEIKSIKEDKGEFKEKDLKDISEKVDSIVEEMSSSLQIIEISSSLNDGNTFSFLQKLLWEAWRDYNNYLENIVK